MEANEFIRLTKDQLRQLEQNRPAECLRIALDLLALVRLRIQTTGTDYTGKRFAPYDPSYAVYGRQARGYQSNFVDFTRTGQLWASIRPEIIEATPERVVVEIKSRTSDKQQILDSQAGRPRRDPRGNILIPSEGERAQLNAWNTARIAKYTSK